MIYWAWSNTLSIAQQWYINKKNGAEVHLLANIKRTFGFGAKSSKYETTERRLEKSAASLFMTSLEAPRRHARERADDRRDRGWPDCCSPARGTSSRGSPDLDHLPPDDRPEIAMAGRSNVGKSTLINALVGQNHLARASNTPGRTQELNFFAPPISQAKLYLVDMPGYGFAEAPKDKVAAWNKVLRGYLAGRRSLLRVFVLIDARHGIKDTDLDILAVAR